MSTTTNLLNVFLPSLHDKHRPIKDYSDGLPAVDHLESPQRVHELLKGIQASRPIKLNEIDALAYNAVYQVHDKDYVDFLMAISETIPQGQEYIPSYFGENLQQAPIQFQGGMYCREIGTPIGPGTITAALNSAAAAQLAAEYITNYKASCIALCRPPGHHAGKRRYGGYSYFNNAYIAANTLSHHGKCAVLDIDYHMGEGSAELASAQTPYFSLHANPHTNYPYLDSPLKISTLHTELVNLKAGIQGEEYMKLLNGVCQKISQLDLDFLILSLGFDTLDSDTLQDDRVHLTTNDYSEISKTVAGLNIPIIVLLEGGYAVNDLYDCGKAFTKHL